jgi:elongation factor P
MSGLKTPAGRGGLPILSGRPALALSSGGFAFTFRSTCMASYGMNDVKNGMKILVNSEPAVITDTEYVKPGKGQAFTRVKYRFIKSGRVVELTMKATDSLEAADVVDTDMQYLYSDGEYWHFMQPETFEQVQADKTGMGGAEKYLKGEEACVVTLWNGTPIAVQPPNFVELKITETDPGVRGDTSGGGGKPATLETGAVVRVPLFVGQDEIIKVDTRTGEYVSRVK